MKKKSIILIALSGAPIGISISIIISIIISLIIDGENFIAVSPIFLNRCDNELTAFIIQTITVAIYGSAQAAASFIWNSEYSLLKQSIYHFLIISSLTLAVALGLGWMPFSLYAVVSFYLLFIFIYLIIWIFIYFSYKIKIKHLNRKLSDSKSED